MSSLSNLQLARAVFKSSPALATVTDSIFAPSGLPLDSGQLNLAREVFFQSFEFNANDSIPPQALFPSVSNLVSSFAESVDLVSKSVTAYIRSLLESCGELGKRVLEMTEKYPTVTAALASGAVIAILTGLAYRFFYIKSSSEGSKIEEIPFLNCPITLAPFVDPVVASDGHTYERNAIEAWFNAGYRFVLIKNFFFFFSFFFFYFSPPEHLQ